MEEVRGHAVGGGHRTEPADIVVGPGIPHDADGLHGQQDGEGLPDGVVESGDADGEAGRGKGWRPPKAGQAESFF